jgi:hypothetical protein
MKTLNIGLVGYGFMGRTHSNAFHQAPHFFDLPCKPVLKAVAARNEARVKTFAENWGYESYVTDWRDLVNRKDIDVIDIATEQAFDAFAQELFPVLAVRPQACLHGFFEFSSQRHLTSPATCASCSRSIVRARQQCLCPDASSFRQRAG